MAETDAIVISVNISAGGVPKAPQTSCDVTVDGLVGDGHDHQKHVNPDRAISLFDQEVLDELNAEGYTLEPGTIGENITVENLSVNDLNVGDRLCFSGGVEIELTDPRTPCFVLDAIDPRLKTELVGRAGFLASVTNTGMLAPGETIEVRKIPG